MSTVNKNGQRKTARQKFVDDYEKCAVVKRKIFNREISGGVARGRARLLPIHRNKFRNAGLLHSYAVKDRGPLHGAPIVRDHDELSVSAHVRDHLNEAAHVGLVQRRVHLVQDAERAGLIAEHGDQKGQSRERLLAAGEQENVLQTLAGRLRGDINSRLSGTVRLRKPHLPGTAAEERLKSIREMRVDDGKSFFKFLARNLVQLADGLLRIRDGLQQIGAFALQEGEALFALVVLLDRHHVYRTHGLDARFHLLVLRFRGGQSIALEQAFLLDDKVFGMRVQFVQTRGTQMLAVGVIASALDFVTAAAVPKLV